MELLIKENACTVYKDNDGRTVVDYAKDKNMKNVIQLINEIKAYDITKNKNAFLDVTIICA